MKSRASEIICFHNGKENSQWLRILVTIEMEDGGDGRRALSRRGPQYGRNFITW